MTTPDAPARKGSSSCMSVLALVLLAVVLFVWQPWRPSAAEFQQADPTGYRACERLDYSNRSGGNISRDASGEAARLALQARTTELAEFVRDEPDMAPVVLNRGDFMDACKSAGYRPE